MQWEVEERSWARIGLVLERQYLDELDIWIKMTK